MTKRVIQLGQDAELIIDEPNYASSADRTAIVTSAILQEFSGLGYVNPAIQYGSLWLRIGAKFCRIEYELHVKRVLNALTAYSEAIDHIQSNPNLYDQRLAKKAVTVLRRCYKDTLR